MKIGILGNGRLGPGLGAMWTAVGHEVVRVVPKAAPQVLLLAARPADLEAWLAQAGDLDGRTLIVPHAPDEPAPDGTPLLSWLPAQVPGAKLVWAFGNVSWTFFADERSVGPREIPLCSADAAARDQVAGLITDLALVPAVASPQRHWPTVYLAAVGA